LGKKNIERTKELDLSCSRVRFESRRTGVDGVYS